MSFTAIQNALRSLKKRGLITYFMTKRKGLCGTFGNHYFSGCFSIGHLLGYPDKQTIYIQIVDTGHVLVDYGANKYQIESAILKLYHPVPRYITNFDYLKELHNIPNVVSKYITNYNHQYLGKQRNSSE